MTIFAAAFLLSLDSFFASIAMGAFGIERNRCARLAIAFGLCDGVASLARKEIVARGGSLVWMTTSDFTLVVVLCLIAAVLILSFTKNKNGPLRFAWTVPVIMGLDNLVNLDFAISSYASVLVVMLVSSSMSFAGFRLAWLVVPILRKAKVPFWGNRAHGGSPVNLLGR